MLKRTIITLTLCLAGTALAADGQMKLPEGHPDISKPATTAPATAKGVLQVRGIQRTAGAPVPAGDKVIVHFYQNDKVIKHEETQLDFQGSARISDVPLTPAPVEAMVMVSHGSLTYQAISPVMNSAMPNATVEVPVYESTTEKPAWKIAMRHLLVTPTEQGVRVVEMLAVNNPSDRTWMGTGSEEERATLVLRLPEGVTDLEPGDGFDEGNLHLHNGTMYNVAPMTPGTTTYQFAYTIPVSGGKAELPIVAPAITQQLVVFAPAEGCEIKTTILEPQGSRKMEQGDMKMLAAAGLGAGQSASLTLSGLANTASASAGGHWTLPQILGAAAVGVVLIGGIGFMLLKPVKPQPQKK